ncbi:MAG: YhcH/YjgK/YiaL family protein [Armatimonadota bacterium]
MIVDTMDNLEQLRSISPLTSKAVDWLQSTDLNALNQGTYELCGRDLYVSVQARDTKPADEGIWEAHRLYLDIQVVIQGRELMGYCPVGRLTSSVPYSEEKDIEFYAGAAESLCLIHQGMFAVFLPQDAHMPNITAGKSAEHGKKLVVKVRL